ncbi:hypothetical protein RD792_004947 [Penstemon davidsonii]|uniref:J domain-containing protein n=1 Tax=Penstemon davidsonii TaxID=160366 RepID=A0ABR0DIT7_9LAMI|nr:hypothetical protein RD792_004947 [Penstemon davidsonii]
MSCRNYGVAQKLPRTENGLRLYTRPDNPPRFVSFRVRPGPVIQSSLNDTVSLLSEQHPISFYELLGIPETGSLLEMKQAYKKLARKYHPDVSPPGRVEEYTQAFIRVQEAYETLSDPRRREMYDLNIAKGLHLAFSRSEFDEEIEEKNEWKSQWQSQLSGLKRRSMYKESSENMSWAARIRRERNES